MLRIAPYFLLSLLIGTIFFLFFSGEQRTAASATVTPIHVDISLDKPIYNPGDKVTLAIRNQFVEGQKLSVEVVNGITETRIFYGSQEITGNTTIISFDLPETDAFYHYLVMVDVIGSDPSLGGSAVGMIFTKENASSVVISDLITDRSEVRPGEPVHIRFQVRDGLGNEIPWVTPSIGLCKPDASKPDLIIITPSNAEGSECIQFYGNLYSSTGTFDITFGVLDDVPIGQYMLTVWADPLYSGKNGFMPAKQEIDFTVNGIPVNPEKKPAEASLVVSESENVPLQFRNGPYGDAYLTFDQHVVFRGEYDDGPPLDNSSEERPTGVVIQWVVLAPDGEVVYEAREIGGESEQGFVSKEFPISRDLERGRYEVYINATQDGNYVPNSGMASFFVTNLQKYDIRAEDHSYAVYFQGIDLDSSDPVFDQVGKSMSFEVKKLDGNFDNRHRYSGDDLGWAILSIEKPLLSGPFIAMFNGKEINVYDWDGNRDIENQTMLKIGPLDESGTLTITAAHAVPEFPALMIMAPIALAVVLVVAKIALKIRTSHKD